MSGQAPYRQGEAVAYVAAAVEHQLRLICHEPDDSLTIAGEFVLSAYRDAWVALSGGSVLAIDPDADQESPHAARQLIENTDHYAVLLILLARVCLHEGKERLAWRLFALNKMLHGLNVSPNVRLPRRFRIAHCVGTVIGRADLGDRLFVSHGCTIGASSAAEYPRLGSGVSLMANRAVLGRCSIGDEVVIGTGVRLINSDVPSGTLVVMGSSGAELIPSEFPRRHSIRVFGPYAPASAPSL